jgi:methylglutaconyl-CoA hydratase
VDLGICPAVVAPWLVKKIGAGPARAMLLLGGTMSGAEGHAKGIASHCVPLDQLEAATLALATGLAKGGPLAIRETKRWLSVLDGSNDEAAIREAAEISARIIQGGEAQERLAKLWGS